ncbi:alpha beta-hydrolase [Lecanosticta acicola]|uniref:Alpha beta-hydrolase n=1 Tax=Lecanosticta acicola TaxID=111012 RepID=A0AAI8Z3I0_9PEZI|nr:alpha beta-hydrolase [Lecanosticta acicola]
MPTLGSGVSHWNNIDDSRWVLERAMVDTHPITSPSHEPGVMISYISCPPKDAESKGTVLLIHGFPQTSYQFRRVITPIADAGYHVIAPDYRGAGQSSKPWDGYTKMAMAEDLHTLLRIIGVRGKVHVVGHEIGGMIAHAYAMQFPQDTTSVAWGECPLPGTAFYDETKHTLPLWHFTFHNVPDLPEALVTGRERIYLKHFFDRLAQNSNAISPHDLDVYTNAYSAPGALRAGFNVYRTLEQDKLDNLEWLQARGKSQVPCLALWGGRSFADLDTARKMCGQFYDDLVYAKTVPSAGHWIAEEQPAAFVKTLVGWFEMFK